MRNISISQIIIICILIVLLTKDSKEFTKYYVKLKKYIKQFIRKKGI